MTHICNGQHEWRTSRLLLAMFNHDESACQIVEDEIGGCARCWKAMALWAIRLTAGNMALRAKGFAAAADSVADELERVTMP
jgi:hypothetical protein